MNWRRRSRTQAAAAAVRTIPVRLHYPARWAFVFFPGWVQAWVLGRHVFFRHSLTDVKPEIICHELAHVCQYADFGIHGVLWQYLWVERRVPYREKSFEVEARRYQQHPEELSRRWPHYRLAIHSKR
jgi:hypothetical protein